MNYYLLLPEDTMTYVKYLSYKTGIYINESVNKTKASEVPLINDHLLYARLGENNNRKRISHKSNKRFYKNVLDKNQINYVVDMSSTNLEKIYTDLDSMVVIIPGVKIVGKVNPETQSEIANIGEKKIVIQKAAYTEFIKYIYTMPGTQPKDLNYIASYNAPYVDAKIQYIQNVYKEKNDELYPENISDYYEKLNIQFSNEFAIDLFVSHQSKDKEPYISEKVDEYRSKNPNKLVWFDKDFFQVGVKSNSAYARNTIAHGILNSKKIELYATHNYFDKLLKNINENADYFGINYELALILNLGNLEILNLNTLEIYMYKYFNENSAKIFDFQKYNEINSKCTLEEFVNINTPKIKKKLKLENVNITSQEIDYLHRV